LIPSRLIPAILTLSLAIASASPLLAQTSAAALNTEQATVLGTELFAKSSSTGMVLVVVHNHDVYIHGFGETAPGSGQAPTANSILRLCSLSKIFATDLLSKLVADHTVHLDDPLQLFAPPHVTVPSRSARGKDTAHPITLLDLATHTSGLPREVGHAPRDTPHFTFPGYNYRWHWLPAQHLKTVPGTAALYSNIGFDFLGDALARATHKPYAQLFAERTTAPLGMRETGFTPTAEQCSRLLVGFHDEGPCTDTQPSAASAGVYSTATDMAIWLKYLLGTTPPAQDPAAQAVYIQPETLISESGLDHAGNPTGIGLGWMHLLPTDSPSHIIEKTGGGAGFTTYIALNHATNTASFVAFTDGPTANHFNVFKEANNLLLQLAGLPPLPPEPPKPVAKPARRRPHHRASR
jgi:D-alanyl-D-alanine-carboxypeptidase/D-alanyl-D-alanine-endopeptidase